LDCAAIPEERIELRHSYLAGVLRDRGVDFPSQWLVVSPATHFLMGGMAIDAEARSSVPGLFVAGESAGGIHGANRLGGNAFCEGLVFGTIAGTEAAALARSDAPQPGGDLDPVCAILDDAAPDPRPALSALWPRLRDAMWR